MTLGCAGISGTDSVVPVKIENGLLVNPDGMTLYVFDRDRAAGAGRSVCLGQCAAYWPPLTAAEDASPRGDYGIIAREDGKRQWTYKGRPLYLWIKDRSPGDRTGDDLNKVWHVVAP
jgi:predicted lipoprotein with Yx(FWY)xxD motif